ncbi:proline dehydrogenase family protein [Candidatus Kaistella beijingensis]|uniref:proline dehydrogenase family protein n=1 Tax=Candidatus Kaistella beijingensis TaxID=2820270 RepID=UPI001CC61A93|nr:proline dehydrogenase family protein [Candidatus Kaistella beijingensis]UBB90469.1 proline dehydrogenase family protein [Candidatus Kaistella beijingensis]
MSIFDNTQIAFADKTTPQLKKAYWMFKAIEQPALTHVGISILNFTVKNNFPFVTDIVKNTLFEQFCGGVTREESMKVVKQMFRHHIGSIFDYAIEGKEEEATFDHTCEEIKQNIKFAEGNPAIPFVVFKPTGFGRLDLYAEVQAGKELTSSEKEEWNRVVNRYEEVCKMAHEKNVVIMIDAEETWIQDAVDKLVNEMKSRYNREKAIVWNTIQMYRTGRLEYLAKDLERAKEKNYFLGYKFVRGAYMEKERNRAQEMNYPDPIQPTKQATDDNFNAAIDFVMKNLDKVSAFFGTHNEKSTELVMDKMREQNLPNDFDHIHFGQLYGMSDNITYYLGAKKYNAAKYLPYGPVKDVVPYLTRRAQENTSVAGQTGRELGLIEKELKRRKA